MPQPAPDLQPAQLAPVADCYSAGERGWMTSWQQGRARVLEPLLSLLSRQRISADALTILSLASGLAFAPLWFISRPAALAMLALHVLLDGIDGPLARFQQTASRRGSFTDTMADQAVVTAVTLTLMLDQVAGILPGGLYIFVYALVALFAMIRNALAAPYSWLVRPRFVIYAWIMVECWLWPGSLNGVLWISCALLGAKAVTGFRRIRSRL